LSSCHMLFFLDFARRAGFVVDSYVDEADGVLGKRSDGRMAMTRVTLRPRVEWAGDPPDADALADLHHKAHEACFIANSVTTEVRVEA
jgi:organic hydroperoxide reductase OsmC/OhrA